ncbi:hypothetical protein JST97_00730 [bacterium]|nr:hypothetical protein [bacterium]
MFRATSLLLTSLAIAALFQSASCQTPDDPQDPPITLNSAPHSMPSSARRWELQGRGDGADHDFIYTTWANPGLFEIVVRAQSQRWMSNTVVSLEDGLGRELMRVRAQVSSDVVGQEEGVYRLLTRQIVRVHVHVDENAGPYSISVSGPIERQ